MRQLLATVVLIVIPLLALLLGIFVADRIPDYHNRGILIGIFGMAGFFVGLAVAGGIRGTNRARRNELNRRYQRL